MTVVLEFEEYQAIRDVIALAQGNLDSWADGQRPVWSAAPDLRAAARVLEEARQRTEDERTVAAPPRPRVGFHLARPWPWWRARRA